MSKAATIEVTKATYVDGYRLRISFTDGKETTVDFSAFLNGDRKQTFEKYRTLSNFKKFKIVDGNVVWGRNWDLIFPVDQLYKGRISL